MGSGVVVVLDVVADNVMQMAGTHKEHVVEAFPSQATDETFADGIGLGRSNRSLEHVDARAPGNVGEEGAILVISVANEILRAFAPRRCFTQLLCGPAIGGGTGHGGMDDSPSLEFDDHEDVPRPAEQVVNDGEIRGPNVSSVILQKSGTCPVRPSTGPTSGSAFDASWAYTSESSAY